MSVEQAVFTSARTGVCDGYHLVAAGDGIRAADARELAAWGPTHDSLRETGADASSVNFHRLAGGNCCVSRTVASGDEYSARGGYRIYTQLFVLGPEEFNRFDNDPFQVLRIARRQGQLNVFDTVPKTLEPIALVPEGAADGYPDLVDTADRYGTPALAGLLEAALTGQPMAASGLPCAKTIVSALVTLLPPSVRPDFSLTTGLRFSPRRPYRLTVLENDAVQRRRVQRTGNVAVFDWNRPGECGPATIEPWVDRVTELARPKRANQLARFLAGFDMEPSAENMNRYADRWEPALEPDAVGKEGVETHRDGIARGTADAVLARMTHAHAPHRRFVGTCDADASARPSGSLDLAHEPLLEKLGNLDDAVLRAVEGDAQALEQVRTLWPEVLGELSPELVDESREQYLRQIVTQWLALRRSPVVDTHQAVAALEVLSLLFEGF